MIKLFHKDVFIPDGVPEVCKQLQKRLLKYFFSTHFREHLENQIEEDRSHTYLKDIVTGCVESLKTMQRDVFEVELTYNNDAWEVTKYCCRIPYDSEQDLVVAIRPKLIGGKVVNNMVVTAWMNASGDHHYTLDKGKYCSKQEWEALTK